MRIPVKMERFYFQRSFLLITCVIWRKVMIEYKQTENLLGQVEYCLYKGGNRMKRTIHKIMALQMAACVCVSISLGAEASAQMQGESVPYLVRVERADLSIFEKPGYDYNSTMVCNPGTYTIVEEQVDLEGNLWGKLKSGAGWIDLDMTQEEPFDTEPITALYADEVFLEEYDSYEFHADRSDYMVKLAFFPEEEWTDVWFGSLDVTNGNYMETEKICSLPSLSVDDTLIVGVEFYGDLTSYSIVFTDEAGWRRHFAVSVSGKDGSLILEEYWT